MNATLERHHFQISRDSEYFNRTELQAQTGQPAEAFFHVLLKELADNALDAAESAGRPPEIGLTVQYTADSIILTVTDNGNGIPAGVIEKILDFRTRTSDKAAYRAPTRGAQGNALKTVIGIPIALGAEQSDMVIEAQGVRHRIMAWLDPAGTVRTDHRTEQAETSGTRFTVSIPGHQWLNIQPEHWALGYALFNPHALVKIQQVEFDGEHANSLQNKNADFYQPTDPAWRRFLPSDPTAPQWYDPDSFARLVQLTIHQHDIPIRSFVRQFRGLTSNAKAKAIVGQVNVDRLASLDGDRARIDQLHQAMCAEASEMKPEALGIIGADHWRALIDPIHPNRFWYKCVKGMAGTVPFVVEAALADSNHPMVMTGVNFSPTFGDPLSSTKLTCPEFTITGLSGFLYRCEATPDDEFTTVLHIVCPALRHLDRGKTRLDAQAEIAEAASTALWSVCKTAFKEMKARERDMARAERQREEQRRDRCAQPTQKELVFDCLPEAVRIATGDGVYPVSARNLFYKVRELLSGEIDGDLGYNYFSQTLLPEYQADHGRIDALYYDPRGWLYEPHSGLETKLGTREVDQYQFPSWRYDKLLYVEKKGLWQILQASELAERYDMAVICAEGFATTAARILFANAQKSRRYQLFVLHDCDPDGYNIARTLANATQRMPDHNIEVVDLGLSLADAQGMGLMAETYTRKKALPQALELTEEELKFFIVQTKGKHHVAQRYELNAMSAPQLIGLIEDGLQAQDADRKLIPPDEVIAHQTRSRYGEKLESRIRNEINKALDIDRLTRQALRSLPRLARLDRAVRWIGHDLEEHRQKSWDEALDDAIAHALRQHKNRIRRAALDALKQKL